MVEYLIPSTVDEVLEFIDKNEAILISGGTDLMVQRRNWAEVKAVFEKKEVYMFNLKELNYILIQNGFLHIGATTPVSDILSCIDAPNLLKEAIGIMASPALRNLATLPGNIVNASPAGDTLPILYALDAEVLVKSMNREFKIPVRELIVGPRKTLLNDNEIIIEVIVPIHTYTKEKFVKVGGRKADAISKLSFTGAVLIEENIVKDLRIAFGAVAALIIRKNDIEAKYIGLSVSEIKSKVDQIIGDYASFITPIDDQRSNKEYRKKVALNLLRDFIINL